MRLPSLLRLSLPISILLFYASASAATWTVTSIAESGLGTLKSAIDSANTSAAARDTIVFAIAGPGPHTISPTGALPSITKSHVFIDGYSQPGSSANTLASGNDAIIKIELSGLLSGAFAGVEIHGDSCRVRGLAVGGWTTGIYMSSLSQGCIIEGNFIGTDPAGTSCAGNTSRGVLSLGPGGHLIGGTAPAARNVISCNGQGIRIDGPSQGNTIQGNYIGTDKDGTADLGNIGSGILMRGTDSNMVGGDVPGAANVLSGNLNAGVELALNSTRTTIQGNFIGTDRTGTADVGNSAYGIWIWEASSNNYIGGTTVAAANVISCNAFTGILLNQAVRNTIVGNLIGTDVTGLIALGGGRIALSDADSNYIGLTGALRNVISGDVDGTAIAVQFGSDANTITNNYVGVGSDGATAMGNQSGVRVTSSSGNTIGEPGVLQVGNIIANSTTFSAIWITGTSLNNRILGNSILGNSDLGIDLGDASGVTPNDLGDGDTGANDLQNYPVLSDAKNSGAGSFIIGSLNSAASSSYFVQVYSSSACDPSGYGEGESVVDTFSVSTNPSGSATFTHQMIVPVANGAVLTATATSASGSTSEFSNCESMVPWSIGNTLQFFLFSPVNMVVTDPIGDSIGIDSASGVIFNTIQFGSSYDTTTDVNSSDLSGPDGNTDDVVTITNPVEGDYTVRIFAEPSASSSDNFTLGIRIDGNQMITPDGYVDQEVSALGTTVSTTVVWTAATTLPGDCNASGTTTSADIIYLVNYVFKGGPAPVVEGHGDVNCNGSVTSADVIYLVNFVFKSGQSPCSHTAG